MNQKGFLIGVLSVPCFQHTAGAALITVNPTNFKREENRNTNEIEFESSPPLRCDLFELDVSANDGQSAQTLEKRKRNLEQFKLRLPSMAARCPAPIFTRR